MPSLLVRLLKLVIVRESESQTEGRGFATQKAAKGEKSPSKGKMSRDAIRPTPKAWRVIPGGCPALDVLRLCSKLPFLVFDGKCGFLALSTAVWTMGKMRDGAQWLSNHYAANDYYARAKK